MSITDKDVKRDEGVSQSGEGDTSKSDTLADSSVAEANTTVAPSASVSQEPVQPVQPDNSVQLQQGQELENADVGTPPPVHDELPSEGPLAQLNKLLPSCITEAGHTEMWGIDITNARDPSCCIVLQKFLRANGNDPEKAADQLTKALRWRKSFRPLDTLNENHSRNKFEGLGYLTYHKPIDDVDDSPKTVITWNIYGGVKDKKATFSDVNEFCRWRVALMELGVQALGIDQATAPIPEDGADMYKMIQVHDYMDVSFLRLDPTIKAASSKVIEIFQTGYPELLEHKYFVNVPYVMNWIFNFFSMFMAKETIAKFHPLAKGTMLANELPNIVNSLPGAYGGQNVALKDDKAAKMPNLKSTEEEQEGLGKTTSGQNTIPSKPDKVVPEAEESAKS